jgi:hypothetical protein
MIKMSSAVRLTQPERICIREKGISTVGGLWVYKVVNGKSFGLLSETQIILKSKIGGPRALYESFYSDEKFWVCCRNLKEGEIFGWIARTKMD